MQQHGKQAKQRETHWFVFLHDDPRANDIVAQALCEPDCVERLCRDHVCADEKPRNLYRVSYREAEMVRKAGGNFGFSVTIFVGEDRARPRKWVDPNVARRRELIRKKARMLED